MEDRKVSAMNAKEGQLYIIKKKPGDLYGVMLDVTSLLRHYHKGLGELSRCRFICRILEESYCVSY